MKDPEPENKGLLVAWYSPTCSLNVWEGGADVTVLTLPLVSM